MTLEQIIEYSQFIDRAEQRFTERLSDPHFYPARHSFWHAVETGYFSLDWPEYEC